MKKGLTHYGDDGFSLYIRKAFIKAMGYTDDALSRPIIGIANTYSGYNACHATIPQIVEAVKRGVMLAGGLPIEFPTISLHESFAFPTSMFLRNLMSMDTEEMIKAQPMDAVVLVGGCDKTVPALLMGAASANVPAIVEVTGPMLTGTHHGERIGACTDCRRFWAKYRGGEIDADEVEELTNQLVPTAGTCGVMGTASTMALMTEAMGMMLPGGAAIPATYADRPRQAEQTGARAVAMAAENLSPDQVMTPAAIRNALRVLHAIGGSTNAIIHTTAIAGRLGIPVDLQEFDALGRDIPVLVDLKPSGRYYMEDLYRAGGLAPILRRLADHLELDALTVTGRTLGEEIEGMAAEYPQDVVRPLDDPIHPGGGIAVLTGNLAPDGAIIKQAAAAPELLVHEGRALVFSSMADLAARIDAPDLDVAADDILVMQNAGPLGAPGMPESGYLPIPRKLAEQGGNDMIRLSDARMSGTAFGSIILHVAPEAAAGGPLALVRTGDRIRLDVPNRRLDLLIDDDELAARRAAWMPPAPHQGAERGYLNLFLESVTQAPEGCDFDFLKAR